MTLQFSLITTLLIIIPASQGAVVNKVESEVKIEANKGIQSGNNSALGIPPTITTASVEENPNLFEGDIILPPEEEKAIHAGEAAGGIIGAHYRWPNGVIPYEFSSQFTPPERRVVEGAMREITEKTTCISFKPKTNERNWIVIQPGGGCSSHIGMINRGPQPVTLSRPDCVNHGNSLHELVHAIGFYHEQSRIDRDDFVTVNMKDVQPVARDNFLKYTSREAHDFGIPYDYDSVMHYPDTAFRTSEAARQGLKTIIPKKPGTTIGQRKYLSKLDTLKIVRMYCPERESRVRNEEKAGKKPQTTTESNIIQISSRFGKGKGFSKTVPTWNPRLYKELYYRNKNHRWNNIFDYDHDHDHDNYLF